MSLSALLTDSHSQLGYWISATVLWQETEELRAQAIAKFIQIGNNLRSVNNFHTLMAIVAGLNMAGCNKTRLKHTWSLVNEELVSSLDDLQVSIPYS
jgi:hypothetical protein